MTERYLSRIQNPELAQSLRASLDQIKASVASADHNGDIYMARNAVSDIVKAVDDLDSMRRSAKLVLELYTGLPFIDGATITASYDWETGDEGVSFTEYKLEVTDLELMPDLECDTVDPDAIGDLLSKLFQDNYCPEGADEGAAIAKALDDRIREIYHPDSEETQGDGVILRYFNDRVFSGDEVTDLYSALDVDGMGQGDSLSLVTTREAVAQAAELGGIDGVAALCFPLQWARLSEALDLPQPQIEAAPAAASRPRAGA